MLINIEKENIRFNRAVIRAVPAFNALLEKHGWEMFRFIIFMHWYESPYAHMPEDQRKEKALALAYRNSRHLISGIQWEDPVIGDAVSEFKECQNQEYDVNYQLYFTFEKKINEANRYLAQLQINDENAVAIKKICEGVKEMMALFKESKAAILRLTGREDEQKPKPPVSYVTKRMMESVKARQNNVS